jgi:DNA repair photolyase
MIRELTAAGIDVSVNVAPVIPGLTDREVPRILEAVADAGAKHACWVTLRLPYQLKALFTDWLARFTPPEQAKHVDSLLRQAHNGKMYDADLAHRGRGRGVLADNLANVFATFQRKYKLDTKFPPLRRDHFKKPAAGGQLSLF